MKICHIITGLGTGGAETMLLKLVRASHGGREKHVVISLMDEGSRGKDIREYATLHCIGLKRGKISLAALITLSQVVRDENPDVIQGWMYHANIASLIVAKLNRKPVFWNIRHSLSALSQEKKLTRLLIKVSALLSPYVALILNNSRKSILQHQQVGFSADNSMPVPNGFDVSHFSPAETVLDNSLRDQIGIPESAIVFSLVARFDPLKNHLGLVSAMHEVMRSDDRIYCVMAGTNINQDNEALLGAINRGVSPERFRLLGELRDVRFVYHLTDYLVLPSVSEGFPNVVGEAMACGKPCIVTDVGDCADVVGNTGWVCKPEAQEDLESALRLAAGMSRTDYDELCLEARKRIVQKYSIEEVYREYVEAYRKFVRVG